MECSKMYHIKNSMYLKEVSNIYLYPVSINERLIYKEYLCTSAILELLCTSFSAASLVVNSVLRKFHFRLILGDSRLLF